MAQEPIYPLLLGVPEYAEQVMRALGLKGDLPREITPAYLLNFVLADFQTPEFAWCKRSILWESGGTQSAVATDFPIFAFGGRAGQSSRATMAIIESVIISNTNGAAQTVEYGLTFAGVGGVALTRTAHVRDDRPAGGTSGYAAGTGSNVANPITSSHSIVTLAAGASIEDRGGWVITNKPDSTGAVAAFIAVGSAINQSLRVGIKWRERALNETEQ